MALSEPDSRLDRLKKSIEAKTALVAKFKPKPASTDPEFETRAAERVVALDLVRQGRIDAKEAKKQAAEQAKQDARDNDLNAAQAELDAKRSERKERKALTKAEAKAKRDDRYAARKNRQNSPSLAASLRG